LTARNWARPRKRDLVLLLVPVAFYVFVAILPIIVGGFFSLTKWSGGRNFSFLGLGNYRHLLSDPAFWKAFLNNLEIIAFCLFGQVGLGLAVALILSTKYLRARNAYRFIIFIPVALSGVVVGLLWSLMFNSSFGLINMLLKLIGKADWVLNWLDDPKIVVISVSFTLIWQYIGLNMVIFLASIQNIPMELIEAASLEGANNLQTARYIKLPLLKSTLQVAIALCIAGNMKIFEHIWIMTGGGPGTSSSVMAIYAYKMSFGNFILGYGAAISIGTIIMSSLLLVVTKLLTNRGSRNESY
jgi:raffinose/stachyose/melibiose transport system permease protein